MVLSHTYIAVKVVGLLVCAFKMVFLLILLSLLSLLCVVLAMFHVMYVWI